MKSGSKIEESCRESLPMTIQMIEIFARFQVASYSLWFIQLQEGLLQRQCSQRELNKITVVSRILSLYQRTNVKRPIKDSCKSIRSERPHIHGNATIIWIISAYSSNLVSFCKQRKSYIPTPTTCEGLPVGSWQPINSEQFRIVDPFIHYNNITEWNLWPNYNSKVSMVYKPSKK